MDLSLSLPSACCCCCGANGCGWVEHWTTLQRWTPSGSPVVSGGQFQIEPGQALAAAERSAVGAYSVTTTVTPPPGDGDQAIVMATNDVQGFTGPLYAIALTNMGAPAWGVGGTLIGDPTPVSPSNPTDAQVVLLEWNAAGEWSVTIGDATPVTGTGLVGALVPDHVLLLLTDDSGTGTPAVVTTSTGCTQMPPLPALPFGEVVLGLEPAFYFVLDQTGVEDPVDSSPAALVAQLDAPYTWGQPGPVAGLTALELTGGSFLTTTRVALTASQSRMAFVKTTDAQTTPDYEGDAALTVLGDSTADVWDSFGISAGKLVYTRFNGATWQVFTGATTINDGAWHLVIATYNSVTLEVNLYVDGAADGGGSMISHQAKGGINRYGRGYSAADNYLGTVAQLAAFAVELSPAQVTALWEASV